jgi:hypothetical protein
MTDDQKRIRIAEFCGWTDIRETGGLLVPQQLTGCIPNDSQRLPIPDYLNSLDAMHGAEKCLSKDIALRNEYAEKLMASDIPQPVFFLIHTTAAQKADAMLKIITTP